MAMRKRRLRSRGPARVARIRELRGEAYRQVTAHPKALRLQVDGGIRCVVTTNAQSVVVLTPGGQDGDRQQGLMNLQIARICL